MNKILTLTTAMLLLVFSTMSIAESGFYIAPKVAHVSFDSNCVAAAECDSSSVAYGLNGGYNINERFAIDVTALTGNSLGKYDVDTGGRQVPGYNKDRYSSLQLGVVGKLPVGRGFTLSGEAGHNFYQTKTTGEAGPRKGSNADWYYGVGASYAFNTNKSFNVNWNRTDTSNGYDDIDTASISAVYSF